MPPLGEDLSAEELAYLESNGKGEAPVVAETPAEPPEEAPEAETPADAPVEGAEAEAAADDDEGFEVKVDKNGKQRLVDKSGKFVSHKALHEEREKRKAVQKERDDLLVKHARGEERLAILNEAFNGQQNPQQAKNDDPFAEEAVDATKDPFAAIEQLKRQNAALIAKFNGAETASQQRETFKNVQTAYVDDAKRMMAADPNFEPAYRHLVATRHAELSAIGVNDEAQRNAIISREEGEMVVNAMKNKLSPAEAIYKVAKARGFAPTPPKTPEQTQQENAKKGQEKIANLRNGMKAADTLSNPGTAPSEGLTYAALVAMSDTEFDAAISKMSKQQVDKIMGKIS
jgi:hypothetical protein